MAVIYHHDHLTIMVDLLYAGILASRTFPSFNNGMAYRIFCLLTFINIIAPGLSWAQKDTAVMLPAIEVRSNHLRNQPIGTVTQGWHQKVLQALDHTDLATVLSQSAPFFVKHYGPGSSATTSIRGGSASQTNLLWNGLPIVQPMLGQADFSLTPVFMLDNLQLQSGGNTMQWGGGAVGGTLGLSNHADFSDGWKVQANGLFGSFHQFGQQLRVDAGNDRFQSSTRIMHQKAINDFPFRPHPDLPVQSQRNSQMSNQSALQSFYYKNRQNGTFSMHAWWQQYEREIPPLLTQNRSEAKQHDEFLRLMAMYESSKESHRSWEVRLGHFRQRQQYLDPLQGINGDHRFLHWLADLNVNYQYDTWSLHLGSSHNLITARSTGYDQAMTEYRGALFGSARWQIGAWSLQSGLRQAFVADTWAPLSPYLGLSYQFNSAMELLGKMTRDYRLPALNDRFWSPGGNPNLKAEEGWSQELTLLWMPQWKRHHLKYSQTLFNRNMKNWILWARRPEDLFWSSQNIAKVWSRGLEQRIEYRWSFRASTFTGHVQYAFTRATNEVELVSPRIEKGAQLLYLPRHQWSGGLSWQNTNYHIFYQHQWTGQYQGINDNLNRFQTAQLGVSRHFDWNPMQWRVQLQVNNLFNTDFQVIENRPMPGRHFQCTIKTIIDQKK